MEVDVMEVDTFEAFDLTTDGQGIATFKKGDEIFRFAMPIEQLERMAAASADFLNRNTKLGEKSDVLAATVTWYEVGLATNGWRVLSLTTKDGALRRFALDKAISSGILDSLQAASGTLPGLPKGRAN